MSQILPLDDTFNANNNDAIKQRLVSLVEYAVLAPSSHNTQCWKFVIDTTNVSIKVRPDLERRCEFQSVCCVCLLAAWCLEITPNYINNFISFIILLGNAYYLRYRPHR